MQFITNFTIRTLFGKAEIFKKMCSQNAGDAISETHILRISWEGMPPEPVANFCLRYSAHTFGDRILSCGTEGKAHFRSDGGIGGGGGWLTPNFFRINIFGKLGWPFGKLRQ